MKKYAQVFLWIIICEAIGIAGSVFTASSIPTWYVSINRPSFTPPDWIFGPVWTLLYALMGISIYLVRRKMAQGIDVGRAQQVFFSQLFLNFIWTPIFFGLHNIRLALAVIMLLWLFIIWNIVVFWKVEKIAAWLLMPYLLWVTFATFLNASFALMN